MTVKLLPKFFGIRTLSASNLREYVYQACFSMKVIYESNVQTLMIFIKFTCPVSSSHQKIQTYDTQGVSCSIASEVGRRIYLFLEILPRGSCDSSLSACNFNLNHALWRNYQNHSSMKSEWHEHYTTSWMFFSRSMLPGFFHSDWYSSLRTATSLPYRLEIRYPISLSFERLGTGVSDMLESLATIRARATSLKTEW
ncbi:hypothetical protein LZ32DRAFT_143199 [Colletotrichum eremochloae]|nr:hypothetical protein LZ32DRAFT_143199 [Colletotrichum eremochloae]